MGDIQGISLSSNFRVGELLETESYTVQSRLLVPGSGALYLSGFQLFRDSSGLGLQKMIMTGNYSPMTDVVSEVVKELIEKQVSGKHILKQRWFQGDKEAVRKAEAVRGG